MLSSLYTIPEEDENEYGMKYKSNIHPYERPIRD